MYHVVLRKEAKKALQKIDKRFKRRILAALKGLEQEPFMGKPLLGELAGRFTIRVWPYRIVYRVYRNELVILVIDIEHRQGAY